MPPNVAPSVYSEVPSLTVSLAGPIGGSPQTDTSSGSLPKETGATSEDQSSPSGGGGPNVGLIAGAVVGGVAAIVLIVLAFFLGRKFASKRKKDAEAVETTTADPASPQPSTSPVTQLSVSPLTQAPASPVRESVVAPFGDPDQQQKQQLQEQQLQQQQQQQPAAVWGQTQPATWDQQGGTYFYSQPVGNMAELPPPEVQELPGQSDPYQYYGGQGAVSQSPPPQAGQGFGQQSPQTTQQA
jgi:FtsZ-interacting cell division protein ZipA